MKEMSIEEHLTDLRSTMIKVAVILVGSFAVTFTYGEQIERFLLEPILRVLNAGAATAAAQGAGATPPSALGQVMTIGILDKVLAKFQVALWSSIILSSPLWFWQLWGFIKPGLLDKEIKVIRPFMLAGFALFWMGVCFGYYLVFPATFEVLVHYGLSDVTVNIALREYLILSLKVLIFLGFVFQVPNALVILGFMGLVTKYSLRKQRSLVYVALACSSAFFTPPDVVTMMALWVPMVLLFEIGIIAVAFIVHPYLNRRYGVTKTNSD